MKKLFLPLFALVLASLACGTPSSPVSVAPQDDQIATHIAQTVAARNAESLIEEKIQNILGLDYPQDALELVLFSDGSTDIVSNHGRRTLKE